MAKLGLQASPDRAEGTLLEEFLEQYMECKEIGVDEKDVREQMAVARATSVEQLTADLYEQALEEQANGVKGLTKFLAKWKGDTSRPSASSLRSWNVVGDAKEQQAGLGDKAPTVTPGSSVKSQSLGGFSVAPPPGISVVPPPGIYGQDDRKAGTGGGDPMVDIAKAIQQQTNELAALVKGQVDHSHGPAGTMKGLGRQSEELVYLLRACGQYDVAVGDQEYGANLANALLAAQVGASTKLRAAGFRQKVTPRLAIGVAGPYWGLQDKHCLSVADFVGYTDAELDLYVTEARTGKAQHDGRPAQPTKFEEWLGRARRENDIWCLLYGKEWRAVKGHALGLVEEWHVGAPHRWPLAVISEVWEELHWRFGEELKEELRKRSRRSRAGRLCRSAILSSTPSCQTPRATPPSRCLAPLT